jgi:outer membrane protein assembly factor BamD (BamD/ComL family)
MARTISRFLFLSLLLAMPAWSAQDQNQGPKPGESSSRPQGPAQAPDVEAANARSDTASAAEDVEVASFYLRKGDPNAAIPRLQEAIQLKPNWGQPRLQLAEAYEKTGDKLSAAKTYKEYLQAFPKAPDTKKIQKKIEKLTAQ